MLGKSHIKFLVKVSLGTPVTSATLNSYRCENVRHFAAWDKSILANQYSRKYCSRSLSNKEPLYISMQKRDVT